MKRWLMVLLFAAGGRDRNRASGAMHAAVGQPDARQAPQGELTARRFIETDYHASDKIARDI